MALLHRTRGLVLAGVTALAVAVPLAPVLPTSAAIAAPAPTTVAVAAASTAAVATVVPASDRKKKSSRSARSFAVRAARVIAAGNALKGVPYRYGGATPRGFDCSGFTMYVYRKVGIKLAHSATAQMHKAHRISRSAARKGDLVFFRSGGRAYHVGIYAGNGRVLHSPRPGQSVRTVKIWTSNVSYGRVL